jgi:hypothetical protein
MLDAPRELLLLALAPLEPPLPNALELRDPLPLETLRSPTRSPDPRLLGSLALRVLAVPPCRALDPLRSRIAACSVRPVPPFCRAVCND